ncbi:A disintegrin and metalloproteinase with thrombospondin motifs 9 [Holothuria leucospilota]|uniref:A disintegrin and metalloproteinase with thrombospondin motifs 9 n=1 Tax=Holothuria leucospilota TaxID=206669 RepID=A0A9Q1HIY1_HOLLE|nr:A disintegrin and metalloproteinase with thrombospondin motifs 9 [Holothuria leucospilota]
MTMALPSAQWFFMCLQTYNRVRPSYRMRTFHPAALLLILPLLVSFIVADQPSLAGKDGNSSPWKQEVVSPNRLDGRGSLIHRTRHFQKRSLSFYGSEEEKLSFHEEGEEAVFYSIDAFGEQFLLNLKRDHSFISPTYRVDVNGQDKLNESAFDSLRHCFYSGSVNNHDASFAVFSLCGGMSGLFQIYNGSQFLIEPVKAHKDQEIHEQPLQKEHIISTHNPDYQAPPPTAGVDQPQTCGTKMSDADKELPIANSFSSQLNSMTEHIGKRLKSQEADKNESNKVKSRRKRFMSYEHFLELMVVADSKMVDHHGDNVQHYILTLTSMVDRIFRDPSIGNSIDVVLVQRVMLLPEVEPDLEISSSSTSTLRSFCAWQKRQNEPNGHPHHFDTAILLTRENICRTETACDTLGLAELGTICDLNRSCSIVEDNGLSAAFTMAHEMGHVFNLPHDDARKCEEYIGSAYHVMAPTLNHSTKPWTWSNCSRHYLTSFLEAGHAHCLWNKPNDTQALPSYLPGEVYNTTKQCAIVFGENSRLCPFTKYKSCSLLWCTGSHRSRDTSGAGCYTHQVPQADGTPCELNKMGPEWCIRRKCVPRTPNAVEIHGGWGQWAPFGTCSRTCGGGVQQSRRECNDPVPQNGGKYCIGDRMRFRSCAIEPCPPDSKDFREEQCAAFNTEGTEWVAKFTGVHDNDVCKLFCQKKNNPTSFQRKSKQVIDGTTCKPGGDDICVQGQCKRAGCDHRLGSLTKRDNCYVCGGDNSTCRQLSGTYSQQKWGYSQVVEIPIYATNLVVTQRSYSTQDDNFLALRSRTGTYYFNGNFVVSTSLRKIKMVGVVVTYSGSDQIVESITSEGQFNESITVEVLSVGRTILPPNITYSYYVPLQGEADYAWDNNGPWGTCSRLCGGNKSRALWCIRRDDSTRVSPSKCTQPMPSRIYKPCNNKCFLRWEELARSECSSRCGQGLQQVDMRCYKVMKKTGRKKIEHDDHCAILERKPPRVRPCQGLCPSAHWQYSDWTTCSRPCNNGTRVRNAICRNSRGQTVNESQCTEPKHVKEQCNIDPCPQWRVSHYSSCSVTCGRGQMLRTVMCYQDEVRVRDELCPASLRPEHVRPCEESMCPSWQHGSWGECSVSCGRGTKVRSARCLRYDGMQINDDMCNPATKPVEDQSCEMPACDGDQIFSLGARTFAGQWRMGAWTECSETCGPGKKERYVTCSSLDGTPTDDNMCDPVLRPSSMEVCEVRPCTHWESGIWQECSKSCGKGVKQRTVLCRHEDGQYISDDYCGQEEKPDTRQSCKIRSCRRKQRRWKKERWSQCSVLCGHGIKTRNVTCLDEYRNILQDSECSDPKPREVRKCAKAPCGQWMTGSWTECSVTCGKGQMFRPVLCVGDGQIMEDGVCRVRRQHKPMSVKGCSMEDCPRYKWFKGEWEECSASCGGGERRRGVVCQNRDTGETAEESDCSHRRKPHTVMACNRDPCRAMRAKWIAGQWSECSRTCNAGTQVRQVICQAFSKQGWPIPGNADICDESVKPPTSSECNLGGCEDEAVWFTGEWSECSATCGEGTQVREVECQDRYGRRIAENACQVPAIRPVSSRECSLRSCQQSSCKDIQQLGNITEDGEYKLLINGHFMNIFCYQMSSTSPLEFLTLPQDVENFSEIYSKRLLAPLHCPYEGRRNESCSCTNAGHQEAGYTTFSKVRLNITSLEIITTDSTFARVHQGFFVPYATAGDCYSAVECPQGNFRINLRTTGFTVSSESEWSTKGYAVSKVIRATESNQFIEGHCGGYCGVCLPSRLKGRVIPLDVL